MTEPRVRLIDGKPVTCRTCRYVMDPRFPLKFHGGRLGYRADCFEVICCRVAPPTEFRWMNTAVEPFCGQHEPDEGTMPADPRAGGLRVPRKG